MKEIAYKFAGENNWLFLGRGYHYPIALEGALKLKEISYIHAEGMPAAEMKHGPIALISDGMPVVFIATKGSQYDKVISNIEEVRARGAETIAIVTEGSERLADVGGRTIAVARTEWLLQPVVAILPLQLLAYDIARNRGLNVDQPRNLAKTVTVE